MADAPDKWRAYAAYLIREFHPLPALIPGEDVEALAHMLHAMGDAQARWQKSEIARDARKRKAKPTPNYDATLIVKYTTADGATTCEVDVEATTHDGVPIALTADEQLAILDRAKQRVMERARRGK